MRAAVEQRDAGETGTMYSGDVSPEIARQSKTVVVYAGGKVKEYSVKADGAAEERVMDADKDDRIVKADGGTNGR
jgi:hypothetical protein